MRAGSSRRVRAGSKTKRNQSQLTVMAHSLPKQMRLSSEPCDAALLGACGTGEGRVPMAAGAARIHRGEKKWLKTEPATQGPIRRKPPRPKGALSKAVYSLRVKTNLSKQKKVGSQSPNRGCFLLVSSWSSGFPSFPHSSSFLSQTQPKVIVSYLDWHS